MRHSDLVVNRDLTFNIIFVPGTVPFLCVAARSLLRHSPYRYRLVSNGLGEEELQVLEAFCLSDSRLDFYAYPSPFPVEHGTLLTLLFRMQHDEFFCFADSDVFARGSFHAWLEEELDRCDAVASCSALLWEDLPPSEGFLGRCTHTPAGTRNLGSYFAVYRAGPVAEAMDETGIGFEKRIHGRHVTPYERGLLEKEGWTGGTCDTGNLLGYELRRRGGRLTHRDDDSLLHLGGISWWLWKKRGSPDRSAQGHVVLRDTDLELTARERKNTSGEELKACLLRKRKEARAAWFASYLYYLFGEAPRPSLDVHNADHRERILSACEEIDRAFGSASEWRL